MRVEHFMNFDTHAAVKRLIAVGLEDRVAEEVVTSIACSRDYDFSKLVTKEESSKGFNKIETEIALIKQEIKASRKEFKAEIEAPRKELKADIEASRRELKAEIEASRKEARADNSALKSELKAEIDALRKELIAEIANSKNDILKWFVGLFVVQMTSVVGLFITILIKLYF